ncbi:hypothetical protein ABZX92_02445 [Lentzea sp. NPDC006480]|uniref:hypothetical protein n=1 Tax=Lentzea sp. NPDC006480 TaxID=3157176 RepID=UPI0033A4A211
MYAGYFPRFNINEIEDRARLLPIHLATQLNPFNIILYSQLYGWSWFDHYMNKTAATRRVLLTEVLSYAGISERTTTAIKKIDRELFTPKDLTLFSYLNWSIPIGAGTCLSAPGVTAIMCDELTGDLNGVGVEVGVGVGYHAHLLLTINPRLRIIGYEASTYAASRARDLAKNLGSTRLNIVNESFSESSQIEHELALAYHTAVSHHHPSRNIAGALLEGARYVFPRALTSTEYFTEPTDEWLHGLFPTYDRYRVLGVSTACSLATYRVIDGVLQQTNCMYGVRFVGWRDKVVDGSTTMSNFGLTELTRAYSLRERYEGK